MLIAVMSPLHFLPYTLNMMPSSKLETERPPEVWLVVLSASTTAFNELSTSDGMGVSTAAQNPCSKEILQIKEIVEIGSWRWTPATTQNMLAQN